MIRVQHRPNAVATAPVKPALVGAWPLLVELYRPRIWRYILLLCLVIVTRAASFAIPASTKYLVDDVILKRNASLLVPIVVVMMVAALVQAVTAGWATLLASNEGYRVTAELRCRVQEHLQYLSLPFYDRSTSGELASRVMEEPSGVRHLFGQALVDFVGGLLMAAYALIYLWSLSPELTVAVVTCLGGFVLISRYAFVPAHAHFVDTFNRLRQISGEVSETISGIRVVKGYHAERHESLRFRRSIGSLLEAQLRLARNMSVTSTLAVFLTSGISAGLLYLAARQILFGTLTIGGLATFMALLSFLMAPMLQLTGLAGLLAESLAGLEQVTEMLKEPREDNQAPNTRSAGRLRGDVLFCGVSFAYEQGREGVKDISFVAAEGTVTALVGPSGAGKSTVLNLIAALYQPCNGVIKIDGHTLRELDLYSYRRQLGIMLQDGFLFSGSIWDNVLFGKKDASNAEVQYACQAAHVSEFVDRLPRKYETLIGERGIKLSAGQRQRLALARAFLADPRILILDEPTSHLDAESAAVIHDGLAEVMKGRTTFIAAHRLASIRNADQILFFEKGVLVEQGSHQALYDKQGRYHRLWIGQQHELLNVCVPDNDATPYAKNA